MTDPTVLWQAAAAVVDTLVAGAEDAAWDVEGCVTVGEPSVDCDRIYVWVGNITPLQQAQCTVASRVRFNYFIGSCLGAEISEDCAWWEERSPAYLDKVWATWVGLVNAVLSDSLCAGVTCADITLGPLTSVEGADFGVFRGFVDIVLSPRAGS